MKADVTLDIKGEVCPYTFVHSKLALEELAPGQVLEVITDHKPATLNVPRSVEGEGHKVLEITQINDTDWKMVFQKKS